MKRTLQKSLYLKILLAMLATFFLAQVFPFIFIINSCKINLLRMEQQIHWNLAAELAQRTRALLNEERNFKKLESVVSELNIINPSSKMYLLDHQGKIIFSGLKGQRVKLTTVDLKPIHQVLQSIKTDLPIEGDNPALPTRKTIFSVAETLINNNPGYVYVTLSNTLIDHLREFSKVRFFIFKPLVFWLSLFIISAVVLGILFAFYVSRHLRNILKSVRQFERGRFDIRSRIYSNDEMEVLSKTVNHMADAIVERKEKLEKLSKRRRDLIGNIAHDLQGILSSAHGALEILAASDSAPEQAVQHRLLGIVKKSCELESALLKDLSELTQLEAKEQLPQLSNFSLKNLISDLLPTLTQTANKKSIAIDFSCPPNISDTLGDKLQISRVINNLVGNAIRYTPSGGFVSILLEQMEHGVKVDVSDTGIGIDATALPFIFDDFFRAHAGHKDDPGGTGLGLAIVKRIIELHGSQITVNSTVDKGTTFSFTLAHATTDEKISKTTLS